MILFVCETQAQILNAINIKTNLFSDKDADLCICYNNEKVVFISEKIREYGIFKNVYLYKAVLNTNQSLKAKVGKAVSNIFLIRNMKRVLPNYDKNYERIYISGPSLSCIGVYYYFYKKNNIVKLSLYEEGLFEYYEFSFKNKMRRLYSKLFYGVYYLDNADEIYVYEPQLLLDKPKDVVAKKIPLLTAFDTKYIHMLNEIFSFEKANVAMFAGYKYLYIEQAFAKDEENYIQKEIISKIASRVGENNLLIKLHPASSNDKYSDLGLTCIKTKESMEMILLNASNYQVTIVTICSSAAFNFRLVFGQTPQIVLLYKIFESVKLTEGISRFINKFYNNYPEEKIFVPKDFEELNLYNWENGNEQ